MANGQRPRIQVGLYGGLCHGPGNCHLQTMLLVLCTLTASWVSVTKASGLSNAPGAERSLNRKDGDTMTLSPRLMLAPSMAFI